MSVDLVLPGGTTTLHTDSGVFSSSRIDTGTKTLLVETAVHPEAPQWPVGDLVDLGCGYGPIAVTLALRHPQRTVWAVDPNRRALELTARNASGNGVGDRVRTVTPEEFPEDQRIAGIVSNPPIRIGKTALHELLDTWLLRLVEGGEAWLVVQKHLGSDSLARWMTERGYRVDRITSRKGYRVLRVRAGEPDRP